MRTLIKVVFSLMTIVLFVVAIVFVTRASLTSTIQAIISLLLLLMIVLSVFVLHFFTIIYSKNWFKSVEELDTQTRELKDEWDKVHHLAQVIGNHEALKMWEEEKKKKEAEKIDTNE